MDTHIMYIFSAHVHASLPYRTSLTKYKCKGKIIKDFKMATAKR